MTVGLSVLLVFALANEWEIVAGIRVGGVTTSTCHADLLKFHGEEQVGRGEIDVGEGEGELGTILFPDDPRRRLEILWKDPQNLCSPKRMQIGGDVSMWKTREGIGLGTSLEELERLNGKPFVLLGFQWDYSGTIVSWKQGTLSRTLMDCDPECREPGTILRLEPNPEAGVPFGESIQVAGDREFLSSHPVMRRLQPRVSQIVVNFP